MLRISSIDLYYGHVHALKEVTLSVGHGEIVTLIGANGAGKSSVLKAVSGIHPVRRGEILFQNEPLHNMAAHTIVGKGISHCPEGRRIFYDLTVRENLLMGGFLLNKQALTERLEILIDLFPRLRERLDQPGGTLSGGEQQMLAIGRALMANPSLLMLDEPSLGLAPLMVEKIFEQILELNRGGLTVLLVEQNAHIALEISHRAYVLETGAVILAGNSTDLARDPRVQQAYLGG